MKYYDITFDEDMERWELCMHWKRDGQPIDVWSYVLCRIGQRAPKPIAYIHGEGDRVEFNLAGPECVPIVSSRIADLLESVAGPDIERIPVSLEDGTEWEIINVLSCVDAIDHGKSWIVYHPTSYRFRPPEPDKAGMPETVYHIVLDPTKISGQQLFRLEGWNVVLVGSEIVVRALIDAGVSRGLAFQELTTDSDKLGQMRITRKGKLVPWSVEERNKWLRTRVQIT